MTDRPIHARVGELDAILMTHLQAVGAPCTHRALAEWAAALGFDNEDLDRCLVRADRSGAISVDLGSPPCSETRTVALAARDRAGTAYPATG